MSKLLRILLVFLVLPTVGGIIFAVDYLGKDMIVLKNGTHLLVDETWRPAEDLSGEDLYYEQNNRIHFIGAEKIERIQAPGLQNVVVDLKNQVWKGVKHLFAEGDPLFAFRSVANQWLLSPTQFAAFLGVVLLLVLLLSSRRLHRLPPRDTYVEKTAQPTKSTPVSSNQTDVVRFFLNIYRQQIGADDDAAMECVRLNSAVSGANQVFELRVKHFGEWATRRMTIGPLGEDSGSKSKCYFVIYDVHLVVKIPARPVADFESYINSIKKEGHIAEKLAPKECIIPNVSVVLGLIHKLPYYGELSPELVEEKYIQWLYKNPDLQNNLKIQGSFAFFMDLSKYYFLGQIIDNLHDLENTIPNEINENLDLIWDPSKFKGRYGKRRETVCYDMRDVYHQCEAKLRHLMKSGESSHTVSPFQVKTLFSTYLVKGSIAGEDIQLPTDLAQRVDRHLAAIFQENQSTIQAYLNTLREYVHHIRRIQNAPVMSGIIINLLDLLAWLRQKKVAMRDLKPDNLLVAGDPAKYPSFLRSAQNYSMGIIDVETAVDFAPSEPGKIKQPLLGGTPFFATPAHFFKNEALRRAYKNINKTLHLQDWQAVLVMIYRVITGDVLFEQTAGLFGEIKNQILSAGARGMTETDVIKTVSRIFWCSAATEFQVKISRNEAALRSVEVAVPRHVAKMFYKILLKENQSLRDLACSAVQAQPWCGKAETRQLLLDASALKIVQLIVDLEKKAAPSSPNTTEKIEGLKDLLLLKQQIEHKLQLADKLKQPQPKLSAYDLVVMMFNTVSSALYPSAWKDVPRKKKHSSHKCRQEDDTSLAATA